MKPGDDKSRIDPIESREETVFVRTLGSFSLVSSYPDEHVENESDIEVTGRARRLWLLIIYLLLRRDRYVPTTELIDVLWPEGEDLADPKKTLQHNISRARDLLVAQNLPDARNLIVSRPGSYRWNPQRSTAVDIEVFKSLVKRAQNEEDPDERIALHRQAIAIYRGDFLPGFESENWVASVSAYGRSTYVNECLALTRLLSAQGDAREIALVCENALHFAPESEELTVRYMRALVAMGCADKAVSVYDGFKTYINNHLGVHPSQEVDLAYQDARRALQSRIVPTEDIRDMLLEEVSSGASMRCDLSSFMAIVRLEARNKEYSGRQSIVLSLGFEGEESKKKMRFLEKTLEKKLRVGDAYTRYSAKQFLAFLPETGEEDASRLVKQLEKSFNKKFPKSKSPLICGWYRL